MEIQEAIQKAIANGYAASNELKPTSSILLDPSFWRALGKSMGWNGDWKDSGFVKYNEWHENHWRTKWHSLIDHLAEGKSVEEFFNHLTQ